jgi:nicotinamidase-related amidase
VTELILTGQAADACVMMTAIDALMRGYEVEVPEDCVAGLTEEGKVFALRRIALLKPWQHNRKR